MPHGSMHVILESQLQMNRIIVTLEDYHAVPKRNFLLSGEIYYLEFWPRAPHSRDVKVHTLCCKCLGSFAFLWCKMPVPEGWNEGGRKATPTSILIFDLWCDTRLRRSRAATPPIFCRLLWIFIEKVCSKFERDWSNNVKGMNFSML